MAFCEHTKRKELNSEIDGWHEGVIGYKNLEYSYLYDFSNEDRLGKNDDENTFLAQMIYWEMAKRVWPDCKLCIAQDKNHRGNKVKFENEDGKGIWFYADVMHNAKPNRNKKKLATILGNDSNVRKDWEKVYHTIGNFVLVPDYPDRQINLIHRDKNEWWDHVLKYMKDTWKYDEAISIQDYIIFTMQQLYVDSIFQPLYAELKGKTFEEFINNYNWEEKIVEWDKEISDKNISELEFIKIHSIKEKEEAANIINFLIRLRGYIICSLLTDEKDVLNMNYNV